MSESNFQKDYSSLNGKVICAKCGRILSAYEVENSICLSCKKIENEPEEVIKEPSSSTSPRPPPPSSYTPPSDPPQESHRHGLNKLTKTLLVALLLIGALAGCAAIVLYLIGQITGGTTLDAVNSTPNPILFEYYNSNDDTRSDFNSSTWKAQTFTPSVSHSIQYVKMKIYRNGSPGKISINIYPTDGSGKPSGSTLVTETHDGNLETDMKGAWVKIDLASSVKLFAQTKYAIVASTSSGDKNNYVGWRIDSTGSTYSGGSAWQYINGVWYLAEANDFMFEEWGIPFGSNSGSPIKTPITPATPTSTTPATPTKTPTIPATTVNQVGQTWSHIGYVKATITGNGITSIIFQDGFSVTCMGETRANLLPQPGAKVEIKYQYDPKSGGNILTSLLPVP